MAGRFSTQLTSPPSAQPALRNGALQLHFALLQQPWCQAHTRAAGGLMPLGHVPVQKWSSPEQGNVSQCWGPCSKGCCQMALLPAAAGETEAQVCCPAPWCSVHTYRVPRSIQQVWQRSAKQVGINTKLSNPICPFIRELLPVLGLEEGEMVKVIHPDRDHRRPPFVSVECLPDIGLNN